jgi:Flp pilus assembly protein TadG
VTARAGSRHAERGQVLAEFAVVSLAVLMMVFGIIDCGRALYTYHLVSDDARLGSRYAIVRGATACPGGSPSPDPLQAYIVGQSPGIVPSALTVTTTCSSPANGCSSSATPWNGAGCVVRVRVNYSFRFLVPLVSTLVIPMTSSSEMVISQ